MVTEKVLGPVAIADGCPAYYRGLAGALVEAGFLVVEPEDPWAWAWAASGDCKARGLLTTLTSTQDADRIATLSASDGDVVAVALLPEPTADAYVAALESGARGVVARDAPLEEIIETVRASFWDRIVIPATVARTLAVRRAPTPPPQISARDIAWLCGLASGETVTCMGRRSGYSERAMHRHLRVLYDRLGANRTDAVVRAAEYGLLARDAQ